MPTYILVATPQIAFGELIRISLEEGGNYRVRLVQTSAELLSSAGHTDFAMAILDSDLGQDSFISLAQTLQEKLPNLQLVVIPPENDTHHPTLAGLKVDAYLSRPFYLPDLIQMIEGLLGPSEKGAVPFETLADTQRTVINAEPMPWMQDLDAVTRQLSTSLSETTAHAIVLMCAGKLCCSAGNFDEPALKEIVTAINRYWNGEITSDMARYIRLESANCEFFSYASYLGDGFILALIYDVTVPLSQMRTQTRRLVQLFKNRNASAPAETPATPALLPPETATSSAVPADLKVPALLEIAGEPENETAETEFGPLEDANLQTNLSLLLAEMPPPDPVLPPASPDSQWVPEVSDLAPVEQADSSFTPSFPWEETGGRRLGSNFAGSKTPTGPLKLPADTDDALSLKTDATYICILIPGSPQHQLSGELAEKLNVWVPELCSSFGWRLESLAVQPEYLQWIIQVDPTISPAGLVRIIRQNTSIRISALSEKYRIDRPGEDFWAPGYLMSRGNQPPAAHQLRSYIERTRQSQGLANDRLANERLANQRLANT